MKILTKHAGDREKIISRINNLLKDNYLLTLSTVDGDRPCSKTAYYVYDGEFNLYIWTSKDTLSAKNISKNSKVAINIFDSTQKWGTLLMGLQALGKAKSVSSNELIKAGMLYIKRYPRVIKFVKTPRDFHSKAFESKLYKIQLEEIKLFDEKTFGKEEFRSISIKR